MSSRVANVKRNIMSGIINKIVTTILPFAIRTVIIYAIGMEYLGLNTLFTSILQVLNISELGLGYAITYCMYKPVEEGDDKTVCALLNFYRIVYRWLGVGFLIAGLMIMPFITCFINGSYPSDINIYIIYFGFLLNASLSYLLFSYRASILNAHQKKNIQTNISTLVSVIFSLLNITMLIRTKNYYVYIINMNLATIITNLVTAYYSKKYYPQYQCIGRLDENILAKIKKQIVGLVISKLCGISRNSFDTIFISMFLGLTISAMYGNYYMIITSLLGLMTIIDTSILSSVGNSIVSESSQKNYSDLKKFDYLYMLISGWVTVCLLCLYQPFMRTWVGEDFLFSIQIVIMFCIYFYARCIGNVRSIYSDAAGLWWQNRYRAIIEAVVNIILNYVLGKYFGVIGIIGATLISLLIINFGYGSQIIFKYYFNNHKWVDYFLSHCKYTVITTIVAFITYQIVSLVGDEGLVGLILKGTICSIVSIILYGVLYFKNEHARQSLEWALKVIIKK